MTSQGFRAQAAATLETGQGPVRYYRLSVLTDAAATPLDRLPYSIRVLLENVLRHADGDLVGEDDLRNLLQWRPDAVPSREFPFMPERVLLQDFTGVPAVVDLAAMRDRPSPALGGEAKMPSTPWSPAELVDRSLRAG